MLTRVLAHAGRPPEPHDIWGAWNLDVPLLAAIVLVGWIYARGRSGAGRARRASRWFVAAIAAGLLALVSPLEALSGALASAHMVQHLLLMLVLPPLLVLSAPAGALLRGAPPVLRRAGGRWWRHVRPALRAVRRPPVAWGLHVGALWFWHAAVPYEAALHSEPLHALEHASLVVTGVLFWGSVIGTRGATRVARGAGVLVVFAFALQSVFLAALLTFARTPWYPSYAATTEAWGLSPLADQQLAGVIMWVPMGFIYTAIGLRVFVLWIRSVEPDEMAAP